MQQQSTVRMVSRAAEWRAPETRSHGPRKFIARAVSLLTWGFGGLVAFAVYANVLSDDTALRARTDVLARQHAGCGDQCHVTQMQVHRSVLEYRADYDIDGVGTVHITCGRKGIAVGDQECRAQ